MAVTVIIDGRQQTWTGRAAKMVRIIAKRLEQLAREDDNIQVQFNCSGESVKAAVTDHEVASDD